MHYRILAFTKWTLVILIIILIKITNQPINQPNLPADAGKIKELTSKEVQRVLRLIYWVYRPEYSLVSEYSNLLLLKVVLGETLEYRACFSNNIPVIEITTDFIKRISIKWDDSPICLVVGMTVENNETIIRRLSHLNKIERELVIYDSEIIARNMKAKEAFYIIFFWI